MADRFSFTNHPLLDPNQSLTYNHFSNFAELKI